MPIRYGAFQVSLNLAQPSLKNQIVRTSLFASSIGAIALLVPGGDAFDVFVLVQAFLSVCLVFVCGRVVKRSKGQMPLARLYSVRLTVGITVYALSVAILLVLTDFMASFDKRFRLTAAAIWGGLALCLLFSSLIFFYAILPRAKDFARRLADLAATQRAITISELDEMYVPKARRPAPMSTVLTSAGAIFGATTLAKSSLFAATTFLVDFFLVTLFIRGVFSIVYERYRVLSSSDRVRTLIVLDAMPVP